VFVFGLRDKIKVLDEIKDESGIYYGFNTDDSGKPFFLVSDAGKAAPPAVQLIDANTTLTISMTRACIADSPPPGCAQYLDDRQTAKVTGGLEIVGINLNGSAVSLGQSYPIVVRNGGSGSGACNTTAGCNPTYVKSLMQSVSGLASAANSRVDTTHMLSGAADQTSACATVSLSASNAVAQLRLQCTVQSYTTTF
jgi:hypothetical protein